MLKVKNLRIESRGHEIVFVDELEAGGGETVFVKGSTGAGKTLLLKSILGLTTSSFGARVHGLIKINDLEVVQDKPPSWVRVGYHPQRFEYSFITPRVGEELSSVLLTRGYSFKNALKRSIELLESVGLKELVLREINSLSGGEMQCISLLRALACQPQLLVLDEPFTQIDSCRRRVLSRMIREAVENNDAVTLVSGHEWLLENISSTKTLELKSRSQSADGSEALTYNIDSPSRVIEVRNLFFKYNGKTIFNGAELVVENGEFIGIVGPNGSGKTTLVKILMGFLKPLKGFVKVCGLDPRLISDSKLPFMIGYTSQFPSTCITSDNVLMELSSASRRAGVDLETAVSVARGFGLKSPLETPVHKLTLCEQVALSLAVSVLFKPRVIILDEIHQCCDPDFIRNVLSALKEYCSCGVSVIVTSHSEDLLGGYCDRIYRVSGGAIV